VMWIGRSMDMCPPSRREYTVAPVRLTWRSVKRSKEDVHTA